MKRCAMLGAACALAVLARPAAASAHAALTASAPSADSVAQGAPAVVELTFSEAVEVRFSTITVTAPNGQRVDSGDVHAVGDDDHLAVGLKGLLPGRYVVTWQVTAADTHKSSGSYSFMVDE